MDGPSREFERYRELQAYVDWTDDEIEVVETAEHALASKTARVVEEIELKKVGTDHIETIHERLRRQQAEVLKGDPRGASLGGARPS